MCVLSFSETTPDRFGSRVSLAPTTTTRRPCPSRACVPTPVCACVPPPRAITLTAHPHYNHNTRSHTPPSHPWHTAVSLLANVVPYDAGIYRFDTCYVWTRLPLTFRIIFVPARLTGSRHGMPRSFHTEPCSPGICGQQERLFPVTGKYKSHACIIGQWAFGPLSDTLGPGCIFPAIKALNDWSAGDVCVDRNSNQQPVNQQEIHLLFNMGVWKQLTF